MKAIIITKGDNTDSFIPDDARATIKIDKLQPVKDSSGNNTEDMFTVMTLDGIDPFMRLRNWYLGEVMSMNTVVAWAKLTKFKVEVMSGDEIEGVWDTEKDYPEIFRVAVNFTLKEPAPENLTQRKILVYNVDIHGNRVGNGDPFIFNFNKGESVMRSFINLRDDYFYDIVPADEIETSPSEIKGISYDDRGKEYSLFEL